MTVIAIQFIALHDQEVNTEALRKEADAYRQAMEKAELKAARRKAEMAEDERRTIDVP